MQILEAMVTLALLGTPPGPVLAATRTQTCVEEYRTSDIPNSEYRSFMKDCLKRNAPSVAEKTGVSIVRKTRRSICGEQAKGLNLHGDLRTIYLATCTENLDK